MKFCKEYLLLLNSPSSLGFFIEKAQLKPNHLGMVLKKALVCFTYQACVERENWNFSVENYLLFPATWTTHHHSECLAFYLSAGPKIKLPHSAVSLLVSALASWNTTCFQKILTFFTVLSQLGRAVSCSHL